MTHVRLKTKKFVTDIKEDTDIIRVCVRITRWQKSEIVCQNQFIIIFFNIGKILNSYKLI